MESVSQFFIDNLPVVVVVTVIAVAALIFFVWWASKVWFKLNSLPCANHSEIIEKHNDKIESALPSIAKMDSLPCAQHAEVLDRHTAKIGDISNVLSRIEGQLNLLVQMLPQSLQSKTDSMLYSEGISISQKHSPKTLNENGMKISEAFGCDEFLQSNKEWLLGELDKFSPKTALDVQTFSLNVLRMVSANERFNGLKHLIYHSPKIELQKENGSMASVEITLDDVLFVISLPLRDAYLAKHPEIIY